MSSWPNMNQPQQQQGLIQQPKTPLVSPISPTQQQQQQAQAQQQAQMPLASRLLRLTTIDQPYELDKQWSGFLKIVEELIANCTETEAVNKLHEKLSESRSKHTEVCLGLMYGIFVASANETNKVQLYWKLLNHCVRDSFELCRNSLNRLIHEKFHKLLDLPLERILWFVGEFVKMNVNDSETIAILLLRQIISGDFSQRNVWFMSQMLTILHSNKKWTFSHRRILCASVYTYLRLIEDQSTLISKNNTLMSLRQKEIVFCAEAIRERFFDVITIGRDFARIVYFLAFRHKIGEMEAIWNQFIMKPQQQQQPSDLSSSSSSNPTTTTTTNALTTPTTATTTTTTTTTDTTSAPTNTTSSEEMNHYTGVHQLLTMPTRTRYLSCRVTSEMERELSFIMTQVKMGNQRRYQLWFQQRFMNTPESDMLVVDLIRYICCVFHPPNHIIASNYSPRWAMLGWLLKSLKSLQIFENAKLALVFDWLFSNKKENVMNLEPAMLLMVHSIPKYADITQAVLEQLFTYMDTNSQPNLFMGVNREFIIQNVQRAADIVVGVGVVQNFLIMSESPKLEPSVRDRLKKYFPRVTQLPGNTPSSSQQQQQPQQQPSQQQAPLSPQQKERRSSSAQAPKQLLTTPPISPTVQPPLQQLVPPPLQPQVKSDKLPLLPQKSPPTPLDEKRSVIKTEQLYQQSPTPHVPLVSPPSLSSDEDYEMTEQVITDSTVPPLISNAASSDSMESSSSDMMDTTDSEMSPLSSTDTNDQQSDMNDQQQQQQQLTSSEESTDETVRNLLEGLLQSVSTTTPTTTTPTTTPTVQKTKFTQTFEPLFKQLANHMNEYLSKKQTESYEKCKTTITSLFDLLEKNTNVNDAMIQQFASFIIKVLSIEFLFVTNDQSTTTNTNSNTNTTTTTTSIYNDIMDQQYSHMKKVLLFSDQTLLFYMFDHVFKTVMSVLKSGPDANASTTTESNKQKSTTTTTTTATTSNSNNNNATQKKRPSKEGKLSKDRLSLFIKYACMVEPSLGYRGLCFCIKKLHGRIFEEDVLKVHSTSITALASILLHSSNTQHRGAVLTFYEWLLHVRKSIHMMNNNNNNSTAGMMMITDSASSSGAITETVFLSDMKTCIIENSSLFVTILPIISRDMSQHIQRSKPQFYRLLINHLYPSQLSIVESYINSGKLSILFAKGKSTTAASAAARKNSTVNQSSINDEIIAIIDVNNTSNTSNSGGNSNAGTSNGSGGNSVVGNHYDYFEMESLYSLVTSELSYHYRLILHSIPSTTTTTTTNTNSTTEDQSKLKLNDLLYSIFSSLIPTSTSGGMGGGDGRTLIEKLQKCLTNIALTWNQVYQSVINNNNNNSTEIVNSLEEHVLNVDAIRAILSLPISLYYQLPTQLLYQYNISLNQIQIIENQYIQLLKSIEEEQQTQVNNKDETLIHLLSLKQLEDQNAMNDHTSKLFQSEKFMKQIMYLRDKWKNRRQHCFILTQILEGFDMNQTVNRKQSTTQQTTSTTTATTTSTTNRRRTGKQSATNNNNNSSSGSGGGNRKTLTSTRKRRRSTSASRRLPWEDEASTSEEEDDFIVGDDEVDDESNHTTAQQDQQQDEEDHVEDEVDDDDDDDDDQQQQQQQTSSVDDNDDNANAGKNRRRRRMNPRRRMNRRSVYSDEEEEEEEEKDHKSSSSSNKNESSAKSKEQEEDEEEDDEDREEVGGDENAEEIDTTRLEDDDEGSEEDLEDKFLREARNRSKRRRISKR